MSRYLEIKQDTNVENITNSSYGELLTSILYPVISGDAVYEFIPTNFRSFTFFSGATSTENGTLKVSTGETVNGYAAIQSFRSINYKAGRGSVYRFGAIFPNNAVSSISGVGAGSISDELSFGYNGTTFGIWHRYGGRAEVQTLTVTGAAGGSENATVTINGTELTVPLTAGTVQHNAKEIADYITANSTTFYAEQINDTVIVSASTDGDKTGTFSFSSGTAAASFVETTAGITKTSQHYTLSSWNGELPSGFDPAKGNVFQIVFQNGYGNILFYIEDKVSGKFVKCHTIDWANTNVVPNVTNPSLRSLIYVASEGSTTDLSVRVPYITGFILGNPEPTRNPRAFSNTKTVSTTTTNILTIRNKRIFNGIVNQVEIEPRYLTLANDGAKSAIFSLRANATIGGVQNFQNVGSNLVSESEVAGTTVTGGTLLATFVVAKGQSTQVDLAELLIRQPPTLAITVSGRMASGADGDLSAALTWYEDI